MIKYFEKILKREIRNTKKFKRNSTIKIIGISSNTYDFSISLIKKISKKYNLNIKIIEEKYNSLEEIELYKDSILIIPLEGVFLSFLLYNFKKEEKYYFLFKKEKDFQNISYKISEYLISHYLNKIPSIIDNKYSEIIDMIYSLIKRNKKYAISLGNFLDYIQKYY